MPFLVNPVTRSAAHKAAAERRGQIQRYLANLPPDGLSVPRFFSDVNEDSINQDSRTDGSDAAAQLARLRWQLASDERLLLERAIDVVEPFLRAPNHPVQPGSITVSLEPLPFSRLRPSLYPYRAVIRAPWELNLKTAYERIQYRLGIAVEQRPASHVVPFGHCLKGTGGLEGVVGGICRQGRAPHEAFSLTCRHVISDGCASLQYPKPPDELPGSPDAVLISASTHCFLSPLGADASDVHPARESDTRRFQLSRTPLRKQHPERPVAKGWLKYPVGATNHTGEFVRFPHYSVRPVRYKIGVLRWPLSRGWFAQERDSGSWVVEDSLSRIWLGVVVGGYDDDHDTLVADASALIDYFSTLMARSPAPPLRLGLTAQTWPWTAEVSR